MHIPCCTDDMVERILESAAAPVIVFFFASEQAESAKMAKLLEAVSDKYSARVILIKICVDENPAIAEKLGGSFTPSLISFKNRLPISRTSEYRSYEGVCRTIEAGIAHTS